MIRNMHPADELEMVRTDIARLKAREAFLLRGFLGETLPRTGKQAIVEVSMFRSRRFLHDKLPPNILENEAYWVLQCVKCVQVRPR